MSPRTNTAVSHSSLTHTYIIAINPVKSLQAFQRHFFLITLINFSKDKPGNYIFYKKFVKEPFHTKLVVLLHHNAYLYLSAKLRTNFYRFLVKVFKSPDINSISELFRLRYPFFNFCSSASVYDGFSLSIRYLFFNFIPTAINGSICCDNIL